MINEADMAKLLGRPLTSYETENFELYLKIAEQRLESLLCAQICKSSGERTFDSRHGYRSVYIDYFSSINEVKIDDVEVTDYVLKQNDRYDGSWYNILEFDRKRGGEKITVDASWGFRKLPSDLKLLLANMFDQGSVEQGDDSVKSKKIEDFSVTFNESASLDDFMSANSQVINKYGQCNQGTIRHGSVRNYHGWSV